MNPSNFQPSELLALLKKNPIFEKINEDSLQTLFTDLTEIFLSQGETLFQPGDPSDALYFIIKGQLKAVFTQKDGSQVVLSKMGAGEIVGEIQILLGGKRTIIVTAINNTQLLKLPKAAFESLVEKSPEVLQKMAGVISQRLRRSQLVTILPNLFGNSMTCREIESQIEWVHLRRGEALFRQGEVGDSLYMVISGRLRAVIEDDKGNEHVISEIFQGESIGEMALFTGEERGASIYALRDCDLVKLSQSAFEHLIKQNPQMMMAISKTLISRLRQKTIRSSPRHCTTVNIAIVPITSNAPLTDFSIRLVSALSIFDSTLHLTSDRVDSLMEITGAAQMSPKKPQSIRLVTWLDEQENKHRLILYQADMTVTVWTKWCLRRADQILLVADTTNHVTLDEMKTALLNAKCLTTDVSRILVLLYPDGNQQPSGTQQWLSAWQAKIHHHIRWDRNADFERLARFLSGRAIGLVLSGGGARAFAQFGVFQALKEAGIPIDMIGGTSMGAFMGAQCAAEWTLETMLRINRKGLIESNPFKEFTLPIVSLVGSRKLQANLKRAFGERHIEDLWLNFFCISSNLSTQEMVIHQEGLLEKALRCSAAIPGIAEPVVENGSLLVDGGLFNNLPVDVMREFCDTIIAVDVSSNTNLAVNYETMPSSWDVFRSRILPFKKSIQIPSLPDILIGATLVSSIQKAKQVKALADLYIRPPVEKFGLLEFTALEKLIEIGYEHAKNEIAKWEMKNR